MKVLNFFSFFISYFQFQSGALFSTTSRFKFFFPILYSFRFFPSFFKFFNNFLVAPRVPFGLGGRLRAGRGGRQRLATSAATGAALRQLEHRRTAAAHPHHWIPSTSAFPFFFLDSRSVHPNETVVPHNLGVNYPQGIQLIHLSNRVSLTLGSITPWVPAWSNLGVNYPRGFVFSVPDWSSKVTVVPFTLG